MLYYTEYQKLKTQYPNAVLLMQIGDFYEAFDDDAQILSNDASQVVLTRKLGGNDVKMAGFPVHMADQYIEMLIEKGHRVVILNEL